MMVLDKSYETGALWQDIQHGQLIGLFEEFHSSSVRGGDPQAFTRATASLVMYISHHLQLEEAYMETYEYPEAEFHKKEHQKIIQMIKDFRKNYPRFSEDGAKVLEKTILSWVMDHILHNDKKLGEFILTKEAEKGRNQP